VLANGTTTMASGPLSATFGPTWLTPLVTPLLSSTYSVLRSKVIALNNLSQYSHCYVVQLF